VQNWFSAYVLEKKIRKSNLFYEASRNYLENSFAAHLQHLQYKATKYNIKHEDDSKLKITKN